MRTATLPSCAVAILLATLLAACGKPGSQETPASGEPAQSPAGESPAGSLPPDSAPGETQGAPARPTPEAPPPTEPSPAAKPTSAVVEPPLDSMKMARPSAKLGVPVDLKYSFDTAPLANQPAILHLAAVPRVSGTNLDVSVKAVDGIQVVGAGTLNARKASAQGAYRQHFSVTRQASAPTELRVLVTMDLPEGSAFGFFSIPLDSVKDR